VAAQAREWRPANEVEAGLLRALSAGDQRAYFEILASAPLYLPASAEAQQRGAPKLYSWDSDGLRIVPVYTSVEALAHGAGDVADAYLVVSYPDLAANWPDPTWKLAVDPQLSIGVVLDIGDIALAARGELTIPSVADILTAMVTDLVPANPVEDKLRAARLAGDVLAYVEALLDADVLVPVARTVSDPDEIAQPDFPWRPGPGPGRDITVFSSPERLAEGWPDGPSAVLVPFISVAQYWPGEGRAMAVNAGTPLEMTFPAEGVRQLIDKMYSELTGQRPPWSDEPPPLAMMQKVLLPDETSAYLRGGRHVVTGFVYPADDLRRLTTPAALYAGLGLLYPGSPFRPDDAEVHVLRWLAHCPALYRLARGGPDEATRLANGGWMVEPPPLGGTGVAAGDLPVAQLKVDSVFLPHGAVLVELTRTGRETVLASYDADFDAWMPAVPTDLRTMMGQP